MIEWNRTAASIVQLSLMFLVFVLMLLRRKNLGSGKWYFITASGIILFLDLFLFAKRLSTPNFQSAMYYTVFVNFGCFFIYFLYFQQLLKSGIYKLINILIIFLFLITYFGFYYFDPDFFRIFSFKFYFVEVILLMGSIIILLRQTFNSNKVLDIKSYFPFWVCIGLMIIYLGVIPLLLISYSDIKLMNITIFFIILFIVNIIGYLILLAGVLFAKNSK